MNSEQVSVCCIQNLCVGFVELTLIILPLGLRLVISEFSYSSFLHFGIMRLDMDFFNALFVLNFFNRFKSILYFPLFSLKFHLPNIVSAFPDLLGKPVIDLKFSGIHCLIGNYITDIDSFLFIFVVTFSFQKCLTFVSCLKQKTCPQKDGYPLFLTLSSMFIVFKKR